MRANSTRTCRSIGWFAIAGIVLAMLPAAMTRADVQLFGVETRTNSCNLAEINWHSGGLITQFAQQSPLLISDIAYDPSTDQLYGCSLFPNPPAGLYSINRSTGVFTLIGSSQPSIYALAIHPATHQLYGLTLTGALYTLDKSTGAPTFIGSDPDFSFAHGLAFDAAGTLYASDTSGAGTSKLFIVNPANGSATQTATINRDFVVSLAFHPDGTLYGSDNGTNSLIRIALGTGIASTVGQYGNGLGHSAITFVPSPSAGAVFLIAAVLSRRRRN